MSSTHDTRDDARYAAFDTAGDTVVIYDERDHTAWIESDVSVALSAAR